MSGGSQKRGKSGPSNEKINEAADRLLRVGVSLLSLSQEDMLAQLRLDYEMVLAYVDGFRGPLAVAESRLLGIVGEVAPHRLGEVTSRLKTTPAISHKLMRKDSMRLTQMRDIAGARAIFQTQAQANAAAMKLELEYKGAKLINHVENPPPTGYRALHVIVKEGGCPVEIQLRTIRQGRWADTVEDLGNRLGLNRVDNHLKDGLGPPEVVQYLEVAARLLDNEERGSKSEIRRIQKELDAARERFIAWRSQQ